MATKVISKVCIEVDPVHGSRHGDHLCTCSKVAQHGDGKHLCPTCERQWGFPDWSSHPLKKTPTGI